MELFQQTLPSNLTSTTLTTLFGSITLDSNLQRSFTYSFIGRQCNGSWTVLKTFNSTFTSVDTNLNTCINYPNSDIVVTEDSGKYRGIANQDCLSSYYTGWRVLRIVLFSLLGVGIACSAALVAFFVVR